MSSKKSPHVIRTNADVCDALYGRARIWSDRDGTCLAYVFGAALYGSLAERLIRRGWPLTGRDLNYAALPHLAACAAVGQWRKSAPQGAIAGEIHRALDAGGDAGFRAYVERVAELEEHRAEEEAG